MIKCIVTGGNGGIGQSVVKLLRDSDCAVAVIDRREPLQADDGILHVNADLTDRNAANLAIEHCIHKLGSIDVAINAAGIFGPMAPVEKISTEQLELITFGNIRMCLYAMQAELLQMKAAGKGRIINIASVAGTQGIVMKGDYCGAKHAIIGLSKAAALENIKHNIAVNTVSPGFVDTEMTADAIRENPALAGFIAKQTPLKRSITANSVALLIVWLALQAPAEITGSDYIIDGGYSAR